MSSLWCILWSWLVSHTVGKRIIHWKHFKWGVVVHFSHFLLSWFLNSCLHNVVDTLYFLMSTPLGICCLPGLGENQKSVEWNHADWPAIFFSFFPPSLENLFQLFPHICGIGSICQHNLFSPSIEMTKAFNQVLVCDNTCSMWIVFARATAFQCQWLPLWPQYAFFFFTCTMHPALWEH